MDDIVRLMGMDPDDPDFTKLSQAILDMMLHPKTPGNTPLDTIPDISRLLTETTSLTQPQDMPRKIDLLNQALARVERTSDPSLWAGFHRSRGESFLENPQGDRAENIERALEDFKAALEIFTSETLPAEWARTRYDRGSGYLQHIKGERAENIEQAIEDFNAALDVFTPEAFPIEWAKIRGDRGSAYLQSIKGERAENIEQAIEDFNAALKINTRASQPLNWATTLNNRGSAYFYRIHGERAENIKRAIEDFNAALEVFTRERAPRDWAETYNNRGNAYRTHILGNRAKNLEQAIADFNAALEVFTRETTPQDWAMALHNRGSAYLYRNLVLVEDAENLEQAIADFNAALEVFTRETTPQDWAMTLHNRGIAYTERIRGDPAENLEQAIHDSEQALQVFSHQAFPERWASTQGNLAAAYSVRIRGERAENLKQAIHHYEQALTVYRPMAYPQNCRETAYLLGCLLYDEHRFSEAHHALDIAHKAVEALRGEVQRNVAKRTLSEENADLYARLVSCCLKEGDEAAAFAYAAAGKGRAFVDLLATARFDLSAASAKDSALANDLHRARELRQKIDSLLADLTGESRSSIYDSSRVVGSETSRRAALPLDALRAQLSNLQAQEARHWDEMAYKYPALTATQKAPVLSVDQARTLSAELNATLVEYYRHAEGWCAFVVTSNAMHHVPLPGITDDLLERMVTWMLRLEYPVGRNRLSNVRLSEWHDAVIAPLEAYLPQKQPVVLAPFGALHVLPLAAARHPQTGRYVAEDYQIAFAPSLSALCTVSDQVHRTGGDGQAVPRRLLSVAYPGTPDSDHYLPNVLSEAEAIASHFTQVTPLHQEDAAPEAALAHSHDQDAVHFGCHGWFNAEQPEQSGLLLAGGWLTVQRIITELRLEQALVATLAACFSGRAALRRGDEHVGLLQAMLTTGAKAVVASLWLVDDAATRALFEVFYAKLVAGQPPAKALQEAVRSVRAHPGWAHPYYWAAFQVSGLAHGLHEPEPVPLPTT